MSWTGPGLAERPWLAPLLLALAVLAVYGQTLGFSLVWDDPLILDHLADHARSGTLLSADYGYLSHLPIGYWRPLHVLSLWLDRAIGGGDPWAFRAGSLLLYLASVLLLHRFALALLRPGGAFLAALLFAVWPTHTESLGMVTNRHDLLASVFLLLSLLAWERSRRQGAPGWALPAGGAAFLFAALSKESALVLPGALLLWDLILPAPGGASGGAVRGWWRRNRGWLPWWAGAGAASLLLRLALFGPAFGTQAGYPHAGGGAETAGRLALDLSLLLVPWPVRVLYGPAGSALTLFTALAALALIALCLLTGGRRWSRFGLLALAWAAVFLLPVSGLVPIGGAWGAGARYVYLASIGTCLLLGRLAQEGAALPRLRLLAPGGALALALLLGGASFVQARVWRSEEALYPRLNADAPDVPVGPLNLGILLARQGRLEEAQPLLDRAVALSPGDGKAWKLRGKAALMRERFPQAVDSLRQAVRLRPDDAEAYSLLGVALTRSGRREEGEGVFRQAIGRGIDSPDLVHNLALALLGAGRAEEAGAALREGLARHPGDPTLSRDLGRLP